MRWNTKALIQRVLSVTPAGEKIYYWGQFRVGGLRDFRVESRARQGELLLESLAGIGEDVCGRRAVEIGTGWVPIIPLLFWLHGQEECHTYDVTQLLSPQLVVEAAKQLVALYDAAGEATRGGQGEEQFRARLRALRELACASASGYDVLKGCNIHYHAPVDAASTALPNESVDLVYSNTVLEHVPLPELRRLFAESYRILRPGGHITHLIDISDHFSHSDPSITPINFLQFSEAAFSKFNTRFLFQNRLRPSAWHQLISAYGFEIIHWRPTTDKESLQQLPLMRLDKAFAGSAPEEICAVQIEVVARKLPEAGFRSDV
jgi:SAM-dependent methyltransferase